MKDHGGLSTDDLAELSKWYEIQSELSVMKMTESLMRRRLFAKLFPNPKEGTNSVQLEGGYVLKGVYKIDRSVDGAAATSALKELISAGVSVDKVFKVKRELSVTNYKKLNAAQLILVNQCITMKPGSPELKIVKAAEGDANEHTDND